MKFGAAVEKCSVLTLKRRAVRKAFRLRHNMALWPLSQPVKDGFRMGLQLVLWVSLGQILLDTTAIGRQFPGDCSWAAGECRRGNPHGPMTCTQSFHSSLTFSMPCMVTAGWSDPWSDP